MKLIRVHFRLDEVLPEWQAHLLWKKVPMHVVTDNCSAWILFRVPDDWQAGK